MHNTDKGTINIHIVYLVRIAK